MAAHLACGAGSVVSHRSAAMLWQLLPANELRLPVEILVPARERRRAGIVVRRTGRLRNDEVTKLDGIPITTAARTIVDLAASVSARDLEQAIAQILVRRLTTRAQLDRMLTRAPGSRGSARLRALLHGDAALTRSEARSGCSGSSAKRSSPSRRPTRRLRVTRWIFSGEMLGWSSRWTALRLTQTPTPSRRIGGATSR